MASGCVGLDSIQTLGQEARAYDVGQLRFAKQVGHIPHRRQNCQHMASQSLTPEVMKIYDSSQNANQHMSNKNGVKKSCASTKPQSSLQFPAGDTGAHSGQMCLHQDKEDLKA
ncbi:hypothetical protein HHI36_023758 [Cryptolaemus montrouzieri]|uniref:Uncharacterized protein n=1 Tax=Cryptolaemus montrouzieri TaxID=559131 RepID=A0ABD2PHZ8_9CUCU